MINSKNALSKIPTCDEDLMESLYEAFFVARRGKLRTDDENRFEMFFVENVRQLANDIRLRQYKPSRGKAFITDDPVIREIFAAPFRDRIVHHLLYAMNGFWWDRQFINDSYSCRDGKGTLYGIKRVQHFMEKASLAGSQKAYVLKGDISGYFMSLSRLKLMNEILKGLEKQYVLRRSNRVLSWQYKLCRYLWSEVIFDDPVLNVRTVGSPKGWEKLPNNKSLFHQPSGQGIVIGNLTSQLLSNIYLNQFDWYVIRELELPFYGRYVDDFIIIVPESRYEDALSKFQHEIPKKLDALGLLMHPKKIYIQPIEKGVQFLGQYIHRNYTTPGKRIRKNYYNAVRDYMLGLEDEQAITSYHNTGKHTKIFKLEKSIIDRLGWEYFW